MAITANMTTHDGIALTDAYVRVTEAYVKKMGSDWKLVYDDEFVPEMHTLGFDWRTSDKASGSIGSRSTWYEGRNRALQQQTEKSSYVS